MIRNDAAVMPVWKFALLALCILSLWAAHGNVRAAQAEKHFLQLKVTLINENGEKKNFTISSPQAIEKLPSPLKDFTATLVERLSQKPKLSNRLHQFEIRGIPFILDKTDSSTLPAETRQPSDAACRLESPWVQITRQSPAAPADVTVIWNERQVAIDQALLAAPEMPASVPPARPLISWEEFIRWGDAYIVAVAKIAGPEASDELMRLGRQLPMDLLWLFRNSVQTTRAPFAGVAMQSVRVALRRAANGYYPDIVVTLIERHFTGGCRQERFDNIRQLAGILPLQRLKIDNLK